MPTLTPGSSGHRLAHDNPTCLRPVSASKGYCTVCKAQRPASAPSLPASLPTSSPRPSLAPPLEKRGDGHWAVEVEPRERRENGYVISISGTPRHTSRMKALIASYDAPEDLAERIDAALASREKATYLIQGENMFGGMTVSIYSGVLFQGRGGDLGILPGRKTRNGYKVGRVIDMLPGTGVDKANELNARLFSTPIPVTEPVTEEALAAATPEKPLALVGSHPGFGGGAVDGTVWLITEYDPEYKIADGYLWCPESDLESEHGSAYLKDLAYYGVAGTSKVSFSEAFDLPTDRASAYEAIFG